ATVASPSAREDRENGRMAAGAALTWPCCCRTFRAMGAHLPQGAVRDVGDLFRTMVPTGRRPAGGRGRERGQGDWMSSVAYAPAAGFARVFGVRWGGIAALCALLLAGCAGQSGPQVDSIFADSPPAHPMLHPQPQQPLG